MLVPCESQRPASARRGGGRRTRLLAVLLTFVLVTAVMPASAQGACTVTVSPPGGIQAAVDAATTGHVICLAAGTFTAGVIVTKSVTLRGAGDGTTVLDVGASVPGIDIRADNVTITDLRIEKNGGDYGLEVNDATITDLRIERVTATGGSVGFKVGTLADIDGLTVVDSHFDGNNLGWYVAASLPGDPTLTTVTNVDVRSSTFDDNLLKGLYAEKLEHAVLDGITVADSGTDSSYAFNDGISINLKSGTYEDIEIRNATVSGSGLHAGGSGISIKARVDSTAGTTLDDVTLSDVTVTGATVGVRFGESGKDNPGPTNATVTGSSLSGTGGVALDNTTQATVVATGNWWGAASGPTGAMTTGTVTTGPWCVDAACAALSDDATLTSLSLSAGTLSPSFSASQTTYAASVPNDVTSVTVSRSARPGATIVVTGGTLAVGANTITVEVTSAGGAVRTYTIVVTRAAAAPAPAVPTPSPSPSPTPTPSPVPGVPIRTITQEVPAGGRVTTNAEDSGPSPEAPVQLALTSPVAGTVTIQESVAAGATEGWALVGRVLDITAPPATPEEPIVLDLAVDETILDSDAPVAVFRDGVRVQPCDDPDATAAAPDPCVAQRAAANGSTSLTVRTSHASVWTIGIVDASTSELACPADETPRAGFADVGDDATHRAAIDCVTWRGIVHGSSSDAFEPRQPVTRGQMATFLARLLAEVGVELPTAPASPFTDTAGSLHEPAIAQLNRLGVVAGTSPTTFAPGDAVTRAQAAALLVRAHELALGREAREAETGFEDVPADATHGAAIRKLVRLGYTTGVTDTTFAPSATTSRAQAAAFLSRLLTRLVAEGLTP